MLKIDLLELERSEQQLHEQIAPDDPLWDGMDATLLEAVRVDLTAQFAGDGVLVRGSLRSAVGTECRRCLVSVRTPVDQELALWYEPASSAEPEDDECYVLPERGAELDLTDAIREQLVLAAPKYAVCTDACRGLCPKCGADLNEAPCECPPEAEESPWDALKKITWE